MQTVHTDDGTRIAYETAGSGPPLVLVHGSAETRESWRSLRPHLADRFRLIVSDRRGRGESGDGRTYSLAREAADLRTLLDAVDGEPAVFGHSFGALVTLSAATGAALDRLVLYEPPLPVDEAADDLSARLQTVFETEGREAAMRTFYREAAGIPDPERLPVWPDGIHFDLVETVIREQAAAEAVDLAAVGGVETPTLLLTGERSPPQLRRSVQTLGDRLPRSRTLALDGVGHVATRSAPDRVAGTVADFLRGAAD